MLTSIPQSRKKGRTRLIPLRLSPSRHLRLFHGISQAELAVFAGVSLRRIIAAELGNCQLSPEEEAARAAALEKLITKSKEPGRSPRHGA
jgi:DNA-binding XRE family transcriptional regulator